MDLIDDFMVKFGLGVILYKAWGEISFMDLSDDKK